MDSTSSGPLFRIVRGDATADEVAAVVTTLTMMSAASGSKSADTEQSRGIVREWSNRSRLMCKPVFPGPDGWRRSALR